MIEPVDSGDVQPLPRPCKAEPVRASRRPLAALMPLPLHSLDAATIEK